MNQTTATYSSSHRTSGHWLSSGLLACSLMLGCAQAAEPAPERSAAPGFSAGLTVQPSASADSIGLPVYPGAKPYKDADDDGPGADLNLWGGSFGMRLQVLKLRSPDSVDDVARYYREAMARYGRVLDCGNEADPPASDDKSARCDKERPKAGARLFKVGTKKQMRIVSVEPAPRGGTQVQMVRLEFKRD